jgi:lipid-A-disaccharide synthase
LNKIFIAAGEASGDLHAAHLLAALRRRWPKLEAFGLGGPQLAALGSKLLYDLNELAVTGFWEVAKRLRHFQRVERDTIAAVEREQPDLVLLVDYPGLNLRLARALKAKGYCVIYYILPQVWAWKPGRARVLEENCDLLLSILPFEKELFDPTRVRCEFVGHPLLDLISELDSEEDRSVAAGLETDKTIISLLPGSRVVEVVRHYPVMLAAVERLKADYPNLQAVTLRRAELGRNIYDNIEAKAGLRPLDWEADRFELLRQSRLAFVASGTATLETALCGTPFCVVYKTGWLSALIARAVLTLKNVGLANIVAGETVVPEFLQGSLTAVNLYRFADEVLTDDSKRQQMVARLLEIRSRLGDPGAADRAAALIEETITK